jgi:predicted esterase YcpF (UPF0227 family)
VRSPQFIIYLHGFNSSPHSVKAVQMSAFVADNCPHITLVTPNLAITPQAALTQVEAIADDILAQHRDAEIAFVGSSLGGFLATLCSEKYDTKAVLINPGVAPHRLIELLLGEHINPHTGDVYWVTPAHADELEVMGVSHITQPTNYWVLLQQGDETLDYRDALSLYNGARLTLEPLGDHGFVGFNRFLHAIVEFLFEK